VLDLPIFTSIILYLSSAKQNRLDHHKMLLLQTSSCSYTSRLRVTRLSLVTYPTRRQEEQRDQSPSTHFWIVMCARSWRRPTRTLPTLHALQFCSLVDLDHTIDLAIRMRVILTRVLFCCASAYWLERGLDAGNRDAKLTSSSLSIYTVVIEKNLFSALGSKILERLYFAPSSWKLATQPSWRP
jgi:hypothetical protein